MRRLIISIAAIFSLLTGCCSKDCVDVKLSDDFYNDLASEDNRIGSELYLDVFNENLDTLSYDYYISYLRANLAPSAEGLPELIQCANDKYLLADSSYFILVLQYKDNRTIIGDDSRTQVSVDSVYLYSPEGAVPSLKHFAEEINR